MPTPFTSRHVRQMSPTLSVSSSQAFTIGQQQKLNVVTRLAIEGRAKHGQDGASIKIYLKVRSGLSPKLSVLMKLHQISVPLESVTPGMTLPLFPGEQSFKVLLC